MKLNYRVYPILALLSLGLFALTGCNGGSGNTADGSSGKARFLAADVDYSRIGQCVLGTVGTDYGNCTGKDFLNNCEYNSYAPSVTIPGDAKRGYLTDYDEKAYVKSKCPSGTQVVAVTAISQTQQYKNVIIGESGAMIKAPTGDFNTHAEWACYGPCSAMPLQ